MEEQQIREEHQRCKQITEDIYPELKYIKLPRFVGFEEDVITEEQKNDADSHSGTKR